MVTRSGGGDLDFTLSLANGSLRGCAHPAFAAHADPICLWATAVWCRWLPRHALDKLIVRAKRRVTDAKRPWALVTGPAAAFVATAERLGWSVQDSRRVTLDDGSRLHFALD